MLRKKEIITAVGTLAIAAGIGFVMQNSDTAKERYGASGRPAPAAVVPTEAVIGSESTEMLLQVQEIELTSATDLSPVATPATETRVQRVSAPAPADLPAPARDMAPLTENCAVDAVAKPLAGAMVSLSLTAPCAVNERLTVHHNGMMFTESTGPDGTLTVIVPALTEQAVFIMAFANGDGAVAQTTVTDLYGYDRVVLQWRGQAGFQLHAREFGADYGKTGHIWAGVDPDVSGMIQGEHGFLMQLGNTAVAQPLLAEVYTFPTSKAAQQGVIDLSVEAEVTADNCGLEIEAQSIEMTPNGSLKTQDLTLAVPGCDAVGSFLVLNNLVTDLKVASN
jgi:hypothetical protein